MESLALVQLESLASVQQARPEAVLVPELLMGQTNYLGHRT